VPDPVGAGGRREEATVEPEVQLDKLDLSDLVVDVLDRHRLTFLKRAVSGTYKNPPPARSGRIIELRVDVDGTRPQQRLSGDIYQRFSFWGFDFTFYVESFVVESPVVGGTTNEMTITGAVSIYGQPGRTNESIEVHIPRVWIFADPAPACVNWKVNGTTTAIYACPKISEHFRTATIEVDRFQGTVFPPELDPDITPHPAGLPSSVSVREVFERSGIDLTVVHDDVLNDPDSADAGDNWSEVELHDLMEARFDTFANTLQWRMYGVIVPRFGDPAYNSGYYGTMFDWGGWQSGDTFLRQGCAIAEEAIRGRENGTLYDTSPKKDRLILQTFIHEVGHTWNLPHSWQRGVAPSSASTSFMNYPWGFTGGAGGETAFWTSFAWTFDDVELRWMRHADRADVIFGGRDWIGNNLSRYLDPAMEAGAVPVRLELEGPAVVDPAEPVVVSVTLVNDGPVPIPVPRDMSAEAGRLHVYFERPDGEVVEHRPPTYRLVAPEDVLVLGPGERHAVVVQLSFAATGPEFVNPGQYRVRALLSPDGDALLPSNDLRIRVAHPANREVEDLTELVTRPEVAKFLYFGGSARRPELADVLLDAAARFEKASPATTAHLRAAVGEHAARATKSVRIRDGARTIIERSADLRMAAVQLEAGIDLAGRQRTLPAPELARLRGKLDAARAAGGRARATRKAPAKKALAKKALAKKAPAKKR
jgi:hypothetical protein